MKLSVCFKSLFLIFILANSNVFAQTQTRASVLREIESLQTQIKAEQTQLKAKENLLLEPATEDLTAFAEFLKQPDTGLIRLLPREKYDFGEQMTIRGGGAFYSFAKLTYEYGRGSDIAFEQGYLSVGFAGADYGMLAKIGKFSLDDVSLQTPSVQFLAQQTPPTVEAEARVEQRKAQDGTTINGVLYKYRLTALTDHVYVLRSINYDRSDVLVAFKIIREDATDNSLILAWKLLKKFATPRLDRDSVKRN